MSWAALTAAGQIRAISVDAMHWNDRARFREIIADELWKSAGVSPGDIDVAEIYDCFTYGPMMQLKGLGFCEPGEGSHLSQNGVLPRRRTAGQHPHSGFLSEAYIHGLIMCGSRARCVARPA